MTRSEQPMNMIKTTVQLSLGVAFGVGMVLSCSGSSSDRPDAATCACPASEPPLAGRLVTIEGLPQPIPAGEDGGTSVMCPPGLQFLSGGCSTNDPTLSENITLQKFGFNKQYSWYCQFRNNKPITVMVQATVLCLKPAA